METNDGQGFVTDAFCDAIRCLLDDDQMSARLAEGLVVSAVDGQGNQIFLVFKGRWEGPLLGFRIRFPVRARVGSGKPSGRQKPAGNPGGVDPVHLAGFIPGMDAFLRFGQILDQIPVKEDVDQLHSFADAKNRFSCLQEGAGEGKLQKIQRQIDMTAALVGLVKERRMKIPASGKEQPAKFGIFGMKMGESQERRRNI